MSATTTIITVGSPSPEGFPLSAQQRRIWANDVASCVQAVIAIDGPLERDRLCAALERVVGRHQALRTTFHRTGGLKLPLQVVHAALPPTFAEEGTGGAELDALCASERRPFDPERDSPVRARLVAQAPARHVLVLTISALCADRPTLAIALGQLLDAYGGEELNAGEDGVDYLQFAAWQDSLVREDDQATAAFWRDHVARAGRTSPLALESQPGDGGAERGRVQFRRALGAGMRARVAALAADCGVSMRALLLASFQRVLARFAAGGQVATWVTLDPRDAELTAGLCGAVEHDVPLAPDQADGPLRVHVAWTEAALRAACENLPFYRLDRDFGLACPALSIAFCHADEATLAARRAGGALFTALGIGGRVVADLNLTCVDHGDDLTLACAHDVARFAPALAAAVVDGLACALACSSPDSLPGDPPLLAGCAPGQAAAGDRPAPTDVLHHLFEEAVTRAPDRLAVRCDRDELTFDQLNRQANRIGRTLLARGVRRGEPIAICLERSSRVVAAILGVLKAGAAYVPLHTAYPVDRLRAILDAAGVHVVLTNRTSGAAAAFAGREIIEIDGDLPPGPQGDADLPRCATPSDLAYVIHTSGSTGAPRGVEVTHGSVVNLLRALRARIDGAPDRPRRVSLNAPIAFDSSVKQWVQLLDGHTVCVVPEDRRIEPTGLWSFAADAGIDVLDCTPSQLRLLLASGAPSARPGPTVVLVGGEAVDSTLWAAMAAHPTIAFHNVYGPTECTVDATTARVDRASGPIIGRAIDRCQVHVLDAQLRPLPVGAPGELYIGGAGVARGYRGRPAATAERFLPDPFAAAPGARLYRTGDLAVLRGDGQLVYLGRSDGQVKLRGHRIELDEIAAVLRQLPELRDAGVAIRPARSGDPTDARLIAYVVPQAGAEVRRGRLRDHLRERMPEVMVPAAFVVLAELPLTSNGKLAREALPDPDDEAVGQPASGGFVPGDRTTRTIAAIWQEVLGIDKVGARDNFFDLGGHSLRMVQVHARLCEAFGREIPIVDLFRHPSIAALARYFDQGTAAAQTARPSSSRADRRRSAALSRANSKGRRRT